MQIKEIKNYEVIFQAEDIDSLKAICVFAESGLRSKRDIIRKTQDTETPEVLELYGVRVDFEKCLKIISEIRDLGVNKVDGALWCKLVKGREPQ